MLELGSAGGGNGPSEVAPGGRAPGLDSGEEAALLASLEPKEDIEEAMVEQMLEPRWISTVAAAGGVCARGL